MPTEILSQPHIIRIPQKPPFAELHKDEIAQYESDGLTYTQSYAKAYYKANSGKIKDRAIAWQKANPKTHQSHCNTWRDSHRDKVNAYRKIWRASRRDKLIIASRASYHRNIQANLAYGKAYRQQNPDKVRLARRAWREANRDRCLQYNKAHYKVNQEQIKTFSRAYRRGHVERYRSLQRAWREAHPEKHRESEQRRRAIKRRCAYQSVNLEAVLARDGMVCSICGKPLTRQTLSFDHVIPLARGGEHNGENLRPAHRRCNSKKHATIFPTQMALPCLGVPNRITTRLRDHFDQEPSS